MSRTKALSVVLLLLISLAFFNSAMAARDQSRLGEGEGIRRDYHGETGKLSFIGANPDSPIEIPGAMLQGLNPTIRSSEILSVYGPEFGLSNPSQELQLLSIQSQDNGRISTRYQQIYKGIPILAGEVIVNMDDRGGLLSMSGEVSPDPDLSTEPTLSTQEAAGIAVGVIAQQHGLEASALGVSDPELWIYDEQLLQPSDRPAELVWRMEVIGLVHQYIRELVLVNAELGGVSLHFNQVDTLMRFNDSTGAQADLSSAANTMTPSPSPTLASTETPTSLPISSTATFTSPDQPFAQTEEWNALTEEVQQSEELRVIVQLNVPFVPEGDLKTVADTLLQHQQIKQAQVELPGQLGISNAQVQRTFKALPLIVLTVDQDGLQKLAQSNLVQSVQEDVPSPPLLDLSIPLIGADDAWAAGYSGSGQVVAILDTGMDSTHEFLAGKVVAEACFSTTSAASSSLCPDTTDEQIGSGAGINCPSVVKGCDHGTHVAGIAAGSKTGLAGVAKDAELISIQVFSRFDSASYCGVGNTPCALAWTSDQIAALDWLYTQSDTYQIASANMSLGGGSYTAQCDGDSRKLSIDQLRSVDIATVIASANSGSTNAMAAPACISSAISVGSTTNSDVVSIFSNIAPFISLLAPGSSVYSSVPGDLYSSWNGTSMAAPHVAGAWAVMKSKDPNATVDEVLAALTSTGVSIDDTRSGGSVTGMARIQVDAAIAAFSASTATPTPTATQAPVAIVSAGLGSGNPGEQDTSVIVDLESQGGVQVAAFNFDLGYDENQLTVADVTIGGAAASAGKSVTWLLPSTGIVRIVVSGLNQNVIGDGAVANVLFDVLSSAVQASHTLVVNNVVASDPSGGGITVSSTNGSFSVSGANSTPPIQTFSADNGVSLPGNFLCDESQPTCTDGSDLHADAAHAYAIDSSDFYDLRHGRYSLDNAGMTIVSSVHYSTGYANAFWSGSQMVYGDGYGFALADDVVGHELTHGVTQFTSNLFYYYQAGAINESFSDLWGEFVDQTNGAGDDSAGVKWLMGEDISGLGAIRDMENPPTYGDPDKMSSPNYYSGSADFGSFGDFGGVHTNSGVNNKAVYLMTDGGLFNGFTINALGIDKVAAIYYEVQTSLLTSGADYRDLYNALYQGCLNLIPGPQGITTVDCQQVRDATDAVEMNLEPSIGYNPEAEICQDGAPPIDLFIDDLESGAGNWTFGAETGTSSWAWDFGYASSGTRMLWGNDGYISSDSYAAMNADVALLSASQPYLHFNHSFGFKDPDWDGAWLEYSTDSGSSWSDAGALFDGGLDYTGTISTGGGGNPNAGHAAFVGDSHGYISTRYDLSSLAGQNVRFRWRMSLDNNAFGDVGWSVDDIRIYTCGSPAPAPVFTDVPSDYWAREYIEILYSEGYIVGCQSSPLMYCPDLILNRAESAVFVMRGAYGAIADPPYATPAASAFDDVVPAYWGIGWIESMWTDGFTAGCGTDPLIYCPLRDHTRAEGSVFFLRVKNGVAYSPPPPVGIFDDVALVAWYAGWVEAAYSEGLLTPCQTNPLKFCPDDALDRSWAAYMMVWAKGGFGLPAPTLVPTSTATPTPTPIP